MKISVIIPVYNEEKVVFKCLESLSKQSRQSEIIVVDDGSTDNSYARIKNYELRIKNLKLLKQKHQGPGAARNLGTKLANGDILVFVDSDMTFAPDFIEELIKPIEQNKTKGTFTKEEYISNWENVWAKCWNYNKGIAENRSLPQDYPDTALVFRAILKSEFIRVGGFSEGIGWTDDWSLARKLKYQATTTSAICYHSNPASLTEVFLQAQWIGKNEFLSGNPMRGLFNFVRYSFPVTILLGIAKSVFYRELSFLSFKVIYDLGINLGITKSLLTGEKNK